MEPPGFSVPKNSIPVYKSRIQKWSKRISTRIRQRADSSTHVQSSIETSVASSPPINDDPDTSSNLAYLGDNIAVLPKPPVYSPKWRGHDETSGTLEVSVAALMTAVEDLDLEKDTASESRQDASQSIPELNDDVLSIILLNIHGLDVNGKDPFMARSPLMPMSLVSRRMRGLALPIIFAEFYWNPGNRRRRQVVEFPGSFCWALIRNLIVAPSQDGIREIIGGILISVIPNLPLLHTFHWDAWWSPPTPLMRSFHHLQEISTTCCNFSAWTEDDFETFGGLQRLQLHCRSVFVDMMPDGAKDYYLRNAAAFFRVVSPSLTYLEISGSLLKPSIFRTLAWPQLRSFVVSKEPTMTEHLGIEKYVKSMPRLRYLSLETEVYDQPPIWSFHSSAEAEKGSHSSYTLKETAPGLTTLILRSFTLDDPITDHLPPGLVSLAVHLHATSSWHPNGSALFDTAYTVTQRVVRGLASQPDLHLTHLSLHFDKRFDSDVLDLISDRLPNLEYLELKTRSLDGCQQESDLFSCISAAERMSRLRDLYLALGIIQLSIPQYSQNFNLHKSVQPFARRFTARCVALRGIGFRVGVTSPWAELWCRYAVGEDGELTPLAPVDGDPFPLHLAVGEPGHYYWSSLDGNVADRESITEDITEKLVHRREE